MKEKIEALRLEAIEALSLAQSLQEIEALRVKFLGKKGELTAVLKMMGSLSAEERPIMGQLANAVRAELEEKIESRKKELKEAEIEKKLVEESIDITMPGNRRRIGHKHPLSIVLDEVKDIFLGMGFKIATGPEIEWDEYNFEALNIPQDHPARDTQDTFYLSENKLLRSQTSPVQIRVMEQQKPPIRVIAPGRFTAPTLWMPHTRPFSIR